MARLRLATFDEKVARDRLCASAWGAGLTVDQFLAREAVLRAEPWAMAGMRTWLWEEGGDVLASCETFRVGSSVGNARGVSHLIASVFTEHRLRGQGHASAMLSAVIEQVRREGAQSLVLFSEVGPVIYARLGFRPVPSFDVVASAQQGERPPFVAVRGVVHEVGAGVLTLERDAGQVAWHVARERFYAQALGRTPLDGHALETADGSVGFTAYFKTNELQVLWLDAKSDDGRVRLFECARAVAFELGLALVRHWDEGDAAWAKGRYQVVSRDDEMPMFLPLVPGAKQWAHIERAMWG